METALIGSSGACLQTNVLCLGCDEAENGESTYANPALRWASFSRRLRGNSVIAERGRARLLSRRDWLLATGGGGSKYLGPSRLLKS